MKSVLLAAALAAVSISPALAEVTARNPQGVLDALTREGYQAELNPREDGTVRITLTIDGSPSSIQFFNCAADKTNCETLLFAYGMDLPSGTPPEKANEWNANTIHGFVYTDSDADPWLNMTLPTGAGISDELFANLMQLWRQRITEVRGFFDF